MQKPRFNNLGYLQQCARNARRLDAKRITTNEAHEEVREKIMTLFREGKTSLEIAQELNGDWPLKDVRDETKAAVIRAVWMELASPEERMLMNSIKSSNSLFNNHENQDKARNKALRKKGMLVWSESQKEYFKNLLTQESFLRSEQRETRKKGTRQRRRHYNHEKLAQAMNRQFHTNKFTPEHTRSQLDQLRVQERNNDPEYRLSKVRANVRRKLNEAIGIPPLVIVPPEDFEETA